MPSMTIYGVSRLSSPYDLNEVAKIRKTSEMERKILSLQHKIKELDQRIKRLEIMNVRLK